MRRINPTILIFFGLMLVMNYMGGAFSDPKAWIVHMLVMLPGILIGLSFHEFAHGFVSYKLGDPTPKLQGRLTVNPVAHVDPFGFMALLFCGFGWGVPVAIDPSYYKHKRRDELLVSLAGVMMNLLIAIVFSFVLKIMIGTGLQTGELGSLAVDIVVQIILINLVLMIFNLIPVPPLDGFGIITQIFNLRKYDWYYQVYDKGFFILLILIIFNITDRILTPAVMFFWQLLCQYIIY